MKTKILVVSAAALISAGAYMHGGHKPRCLLYLFATKKTEVRAQPSIAALTSNVNDPKDKKKTHHKPENHNGQSHETLATR